MSSARVSARALAARGVTALLLLAVLLFLFSTGLFVRIPLALGLYVGDLVVLTLVVIFIAQAEKLASPLSSVIALALGANASAVGAVVQTVLRLVEVGVAYYALRRPPLILLSPLIGQDNASVVYDGFFLVLTCLVIYNFVKAIVR